MATLKRDKGQTMQWPHERGTKDRQCNVHTKEGQRTDNTMATRKRDKGQTIQWPHERGTKDRQHNGHTKEGILLERNVIS